MNNYKWLCMIGFLTATSFVVAQESHHLRATAYGDAITVQFLPLNPAEWARTLPATYRLERVELANGQVLSATRTVVAQNLRPKDAAWFAEHKAEESGMMEAIGALLYDTTFQFSDKTALDSDSMRWNYLMFEALNRPAVGFALGNMVVDSTATLGKLYRYTLTSPGFPGLAQTLDILCAAGNTVQQPEGLELEFRFPDDRSLSDMLPQQEPTPVPQVFALSKAYGDSILVRWAPNTPELWFASLDRGYHLLRAELQDGLEFPRFDTLALVKPLPKAQAFNLVRASMSDSLAALAAGLLYNQSAPPPPGPMTEQAQVFETKFGFALFAAEGSTVAARILGLGFSDKAVQPGKTYAYRIVAAAAPDFFSHAETSVLNEKTNSTAPTGLTAVPADLLIELHWPAENARQFSAYELERSEDGKNWSRLHQKPLTFLETDVLTFPDFRFRDSVAANYKQYRYRLRGLDSFGDWSNWTEVSAQAVDLTPPPVANLTKAIYNDTTNTALIQWEIAALPVDFKAFYLLLSADVDAPADTLARLGKEEREFLWKPDTLLSGNRGYFFSMLATDNRGNASRSLERYMTVPDLVAPQPPARLAGNIDDDGNVTVVWELSADTDVRGYWIYAANDPSIEFPILNKDILTENSYSWQVASHSLNEYLYVVVSAEDTHYNRGEVSNILKLKRPDKVPPVPPFMETALQDGAAIQVKWKHSSSKDLQQYWLLRKESGEVEQGWAVLDTLDKFKSEYRDTLCRFNQRYHYALIALDDAGNRSDTTNVVSADFNFNGAWAVVKNLQVNQLAPEVPTVQLTWNFDGPDAKIAPGGNFQFLLFRSTGNDYPAYLATVPGNQTSYDDNDVLNGVVYNYSLQVQYGEAGELGKRSSTKSVLTIGKNPVKPEREKPTGTSPAQMLVRSRGLLVRNGDDSPALEDDTDFGRVGTGSVVGHKFSIQNSGELDLLLSEQPVSLEGQDLSVWAIVQPRKQKVRGYGNSEEFTVEFRPRTEGEFTARLRIEGEKPYEFTIKGTGTRKPELDVQGNGVAILNKDNLPTPDDNTDFGGVATGAKATRIFLVKNIGVDPLRLSGAPAILGDAEFSIASFNMPKNNTLTAGAEVPLIVTFLPMETGTHNATLTILSDDEDENPFTFAIQGVGTGPEVSILGENGATIASGATNPGADFGRVGVNGSFSRQFTIKNLGDRALNLTGKPRVAITGPNAADFKLMSDLPAQVKPGGGAEIFTIEFKPGAAGLRQAVVTIENNDANEAIYQFTIQGTGL